MNLVALFRTAAIGSVVLPWLAVGVDFVPGIVPESLLAAVEATLEPGQLFLVATAAVAVGVIGLVATIGLVLFHSWSRPLALASTVAGLVLYPLTPAMVQSAWAAMFLYVSALAWGATLALAYFSPLGERFSKAS